MNFSDVHDVPIPKGGAEAAAAAPAAAAADEQLVGDINDPLPIVPAVDGFISVDINFSDIDESTRILFHDTDEPFPYVAADDDIDSVDAWERMMNDDGTNEEYVIDGQIPNENTVCFGWIKHPGTKKWRKAVQVFSSDLNNYPAWNKDIYDQIIQRLIDVKFFIQRCDRHHSNVGDVVQAAAINRSSSSPKKRKEIVKEGPWFLARPEEILEKTKQRFLDDRKKNKKADAADAPSPVRPDADRVFITDADPVDPFVADAIPAGAAAAAAAGGPVIVHVADPAVVAVAGPAISIAGADDPADNIADADPVPADVADFAENPAEPTTTMTAIRPITDPCYAITKNSTVCFEWHNHPGTQKWREVVQSFAEKCPEWTDTIANSVKDQLLDEHECNRFLVFLHAENKRVCNSIHDGLWFNATDDEILKYTKLQFLALRRPNNNDNGHRRQHDENNHHHHNDTTIVPAPDMNNVAVMANQHQDGSAPDNKNEMTGAVIASHNNNNNDDEAHQNQQGPIADNKHDNNEQNISSASKDEKTPIGYPNGYNYDKTKPADNKNNCLSLIPTVLEPDLNNTDDHWKGNNKAHNNNQEELATGSSTTSHPVMTSTATSLEDTKLQQPALTDNITASITPISPVSACNESCKLQNVGIDVSADTAATSNPQKRCCKIPPHCEPSSIVK